MLQIKENVSRCVFVTLEGKATKYMPMGKAIARRPGVQTTGHVVTAAYGKRSNVTANPNCFDLPHTHDG